MKNFYVTALLASGATFAQAQGLPGYVITLSGDTLRGNVVETDHRHLALYRPTNPLPTTYRAAQLRGYSVGQHPLVESRVVRLASGADSVRFTFPLRTGAASLYSSSGTDLLLRPAAQDTLFELTPGNWHLLFHRYLAGCPGLRQTSDYELSKPFYQPELERQLDVYNACNPTPHLGQAVMGPARRWLTYFWLVGGPTLTVFHFTPKAGEPDRSMPDVGYMVGLEAVNISPSGVLVSGQLSLSQSVTHTDAYSVGSKSAPATESVVYRFRRLCPSLTVGKQFRQSQAIRPFVALGIATGVLYDQEAEVTTQRPTKGPVTEKSVGGPSLEPFVEATTGVWIQAFRRSAVRLSAQYHWRYVHSPFGIPYTSILTLQAGFFIGPK